MANRQPYRPTRHREWTATHASIQAALCAEGWNPWLARAMALRGIATHAEAQGPPRPLPFNGLKGLDHARDRLVAAITAHERIIVVADYDCDGATACAIMVAGLRTVGANIAFAVPNRLKHGYGLSPGVVAMIAERDRPSVLVTVDNGIAAVAGVDAARTLGWDVVVTDHHLPGDAMPSATAIVNPNQPGCTFASKHMAGCGVAFMLVAAIHERLRRSGGLPPTARPVHELLDLVALGTVADVVRLDANNRWLVAAGLRRIRNGPLRPGIEALFEAAGRDPSRAIASDFGFGLGPRLNAAGRLADMTTGIRCLLADDLETARDLAAQLQGWNEDRKDMEAGMIDAAAEQVAAQAGHWTRVVYHPDFHEGVVGLVASRIKENLMCPVVAFAPAQEPGMLKGSGRSVPGLHLRDALDQVHKRGHDLLERFGGHAMAAGLTLAVDRLATFTALFEDVVRSEMGGSPADPTLWVDGVLPPEAWGMDTAMAMRDQIWGQGFEEPLWEATARVVSVKRVGRDRDHLKLVLTDPSGQRTVEAIEFFVPEGLRDPSEGESWRFWLALDVNLFRGEATVSWRIRQKEPTPVAG